MASASDPTRHKLLEEHIREPFITRIGDMERENAILQAEISHFRSQSCCNGGNHSSSRSPLRRGNLQRSVSFNDNQQESAACFPQVNQI